MYKHLASIKRNKVDWQEELKKYVTMTATVIRID